jgi:uncharacterized coiled-coil DUF342 family protein
MAEAANDRSTLEVFQTRVRQLMYEYEKVRDQRDRLHNSLLEKQDEIKTLQDEVKRLQDACQSLKTAKMLEINDGDVEKAKRRIDSIVRQVDRCIALLNV